MKKISSKFIFVFSLLFISLLGSIFSSLYATDVQKQHIILTEVLSEYSQLIDKVTKISEFYLELKIYDDKALERRSDEIENLYDYINSVDSIHKHLKNLEYPLKNGELIELDFSKNFRYDFVEAVSQGEILWQEVERNLLETIEKKMVDETDLREIMEEHKHINQAMIVNSEELIQICRESAEVSKRISDIIQISALIIAFIILIFVTGFVFTGIYKPIMYIKDSFKKMSKGDLSHRFLREKNDEFKELYYDFNEFLDALDIIFDIENKVVKEDILENILILLNKKMKEFINFESIGLVYKNYQGTCIEITVNGDKIESSECNTSKKFLKEMLIEDEILYIPVNLNENLLGYYYFTNFKDKIEDKKFIKLIEDKLNVAFYKNVLIKELLSIITETLSDAAEAKDPETYNHLVRMSNYSQIIAKKLAENGLYTDIIDDEFIKNIKITAPMHDIGKISIPDNILLKPGRLTEDEFVIMKTHALNGAKILNQLDVKMKYYGIEYFQMASTIALHHQEKFNGQGYPNGLKGNDISLVGRIISIADVFDALTSKRPYKEAFSLEKSYNIIRESSGSHFDPDIVDTFFSAQKEIENIYELYKEV